ncbi:MAG: hypothetical protein UR34_C0015G0002 [candidate division WS6 bacterium GW2011_GWC1_33_20]|uniref:Glycosyltransferase RgtA/B/C/D-like domain-containing protein n=1 Tax=candidate division WS6 bacterium GW2011_GWC1_33_20 TaxID=1619089 RepID=A0A0F9ZX17_9BACT|nr:MAG: hypothetical protein UR34_C0015G0002 [candidate division WS6 bacterium GW2011_GWC1_33_20]KKP44757.1 MAG: hypothetical protein UR36_C0014G0002 [candidate division WS6 bacterium GW2011_GWF1_33_233]KKP54324.1 MAG: hypothetical protein UR45_C0018G0002 [candidate division WS6 bacterium GW2011_WS6_33_547]HBB64544.1 hypothetical protein [Patescibacteria group bacterium]
MRKTPKYRYYIYPLIIFLLCIIFTFFKLNWSSVGIYVNYLPTQETFNDDTLFGKPRAVRSDQFLVSLPIAVSQSINREPLINNDMGEGTNLGTQNLPIKNDFSLFKITNIGYYLLDNVELSYSLYCWLEFALFLLSTYLLILHLTKYNLTISIMGSLLFLFTPFFQWWNHFSTITWISFSIFFFLKIVDNLKSRSVLLYSFGFIYSVISFAMLLYPPFQIPLIYIAIIIAVATLIDKWKSIRSNFKLLFPILLSCILFIVFIIFLYIYSFQDLIEITTNTAYPGARFIQAGQGNFVSLFDGFYNILLQADANLAPFSNQSESSNFFLLFPPIVVWILYKNIILFKNLKKIDWLPILLSIISIFFIIWSFFPLPDFISKFSLLYLVPAGRLIIGFGYSSYLLIFYILSKDIYKCRNTKLDWIIAIILSLLYAIFMYFIGKELFSISPDFFSFPAILQPSVKIILVSSFILILLISLFRQHRRLFLTIFLIFAFLSSFLINPLQKGLDILINTDLAKYIQKTSENDDSIWLIYGTHVLAQYALANNAHILNGVHLYPQFEIWEIIDPEKLYFDYYNRYAHVIVSEKQENEDLVELLQSDAIMLNINPCDSKLKDLKVKYIITTAPLNDTTCLTKQESFGNVEVFFLQY